MLGDASEGGAEERYMDLINRAALGRTAPNDPRAVTSIEQWCDEFSKIPLQVQPGTEWVYGYGHDVAGRVIEVVTGQRLDTFVQKRVLGPLDMVDTSFEVSRKKYDHLSAMYRRYEEGVDVTADSQESNPAELAVSTSTNDTDAPNTTSANTEDMEMKGHEDALPKQPVYILSRLDNNHINENEWMAGNASPILAGGGSVDAMTGGLCSTASDFSRFCLCLLRRGELDGQRILKSETVDELLAKNLLPRATNNEGVWCFGTPGVGFSLVGAVSVDHPDLDTALRAGEY